MRERVQAPVGASESGDHDAAAAIRTVPPQGTHACDLGTVPAGAEPVHDPLPDLAVATSVDAARAGLPTARPGRDRALPRGQGGRPVDRWAPLRRVTVIADLLAGTAAATGTAAAAGLSPGRPEILAGCLLAGPALVVWLAMSGLYRKEVAGQGSEEFRRLGVAAVTMLAAASTLALALDADPVRALVLTTLPAVLAASVLVHGTGRAILRRLHRRGRYRQRVVAMGLERSVAELVRTARRDRSVGLEVVAACVAANCDEEIEGVPVLGSPADVLAVLQVAGADAVVLTAWSDVSHEELRRLTWDLEGSGVQVLVAPRLAEVAVPRLRIRTVGGIPLLDVQEPEFTGARRAVKTALDYTLATAALLLLAPVLLGVAAAVRLGSPGPVLFRQERVGRHGRHFTMHKFRSMYIDAEVRLAQLEHLNEGDGLLFKLRDDPRVTPVGRFIRRYSLDELPQLFDVLLGRMSMVGPRPPLPREVAHYHEDVRRRLLVKPGLTGLWQVSGRSDLSWEESVRLDLSYVENWFLGLDLSIIARTVRAVLARNGAY